MNRYTLPIVLLSLSLTYTGWLHDSPHALAAMLVFATPPLLLALLALRGWHHAGYWSSVLALGWFSHGVMRAWTDWPHALSASAVLVLALLVIASASGPSALARLQTRRPPRRTPERTDHG